MDLIAFWDNINMNNTYKWIMIFNIKIDLIVYSEKKMNKNKKLNKAEVRTLTHISDSYTCVLW